MEGIELELALGLVGIAVLLLALCLRREMRAWRWIGLALSVLSLSGGLTLLPSPWSTDTELAAQLPPPNVSEGYRSSGGCRACHPSEYASWQQTFHRTMTQPATPESVAAPFDGRVLEDGSRVFTVEQEGEAFYVYYHGKVGTSAEANPKKKKPRRWRIVLTTGSHNMQVYWVRSSQGNLVQFPWLYVVRDARWLPNEASFLQPPSEPYKAIMANYYWSDNCTFCHTTGPLAPVDESETQVAEIGISCEACHGPGEAHAAANRDPSLRYQTHLSKSADPTIANPARLEPDAASAICARCHYAAPPIYDDELDPNRALVPGERIEDYVFFERLYDLYDDAVAKEVVRELDDEEYDAIGTLWPDYTVRVAGREYSGMAMSACKTKGEMSCLSCHSMHNYAERANLLAPDRQGPEGCRPCHADTFTNLEAHTHHAPTSAGSDCLGCHMPYTSYGLLKATRSHRVDSPRVTGVDSRDRPNACNLCHLDRTLMWTAEALERWYGRKRPALPEEHERLSAGALWIGRGDAVQRVLATWHLGYKPAQQAADVRALVPIAATLVEDDYAALRYVSVDALSRIEGFEDLEPEPMAPPSERAALAEEVLRRWRAGAPKVGRAELLQKSDGSFDKAGFEALLKTRDNHATAIAE